MQISGPWLVLLKKEIFSTFSMSIPDLTAIGKQRPKNNLAMNPGAKPVSIIRKPTNVTVFKLERGVPLIISVL